MKCRRHDWRTILDKEVGWGQSEVASWCIKCGAFKIELEVDNRIMRVLVPVQHPKESER